MVPVAAATVVVTRTCASCVMPEVAAPLKPYQQNQRMNTPSAPMGMLCPGMARTNFASLRFKVGLPSLSRYLPQRGPKMSAPMKEEMPPTIWMSEEPAKST